jgi:hypothetical protein
LGYASAPNSETLEIAADVIGGGIGGAVGGKLGEHFVPLPNIRKELAILRFAHRRSTRAARQGSAQKAFDRRAVINTVVGEGLENGVFTPLTRSIFDWVFRTQPPAGNADSTFRPCAVRGRNERSAIRCRGGTRTRGHMKPQGQARVGSAPTGQRIGSG